MKKSCLPFFAAALTAVICGGLLGYEYFYPYALLCLVCFTFVNKKSNVNAKALYLMLALFVLSFAMLFFGINKEESATLFAKQCVYFSFFMLFSSVSDREKAFFVFMNGILCGALYCFAVNFAALLMGILPVTDGRHAFTLVINYPNALASLFGVSFLWCMSRKEKLYKALSVFCVLGLLLTYSKAAIGITLILTAVYVILSGKKILGGALAALFAAAAVFALRMSSLSSFYERLIYYKDALSVFLAYPLGCGGGGWSSVYNEYQSGFYAVKSVHSSFFAAMTDFGIFGIILFLCTVVLFAKLYLGARKNNKNTADTVFISALFLFLHSLIDTDADFPLFVLIYISCGCMLSQLRGGEKEIVFRRGTKAVSLILSTVFCVFSVSYGFYAAGIKKFSRGDECAAEFDAAAKTNPVSASAFYMLGGVTGDAQKLYRAASLDPMNPKYYAALCSFTSGGEKLQNAERLCTLQPLTAEHYELLSELLKENGEYGKILQLSDTFDSVKKRINPATYLLHPNIKFEKSEKFIKNINKAQDLK